MSNIKVFFDLKRLDNSIITDEKKLEIENYLKQLIGHYFLMVYRIIIDDELNFDVKVNRKGKNNNKLIAEFTLLSTFEGKDAHGVAHILSNNFTCEGFKEYLNRTRFLAGFTRDLRFGENITYLNLIVEYPWESRLVCSSCEAPGIIQAGGHKTCGGKRRSSKKTTTGRTQAKRRTSGGKRRSSNRRRL